MSETPSLEWIASHYSLLQELEPHLRHDTPAATVNNDAWFGKARHGQLH